MMKRILLCALLAFPLSGCAELSSAFGVLNGSVATTAPATTADAEKALTAAHDVLNALAPQIIDAANRGIIHGTTAGEVKKWYDTADDTLKAADQLDAVANAQGVMDKVSAVRILIAQITAAIHPAN